MWVDEETQAFIESKNLNIKTRVMKFEELPYYKNRNKYLNFLKEMKKCSFNQGYLLNDIEPEDVVQLTHNNYIYFLSIALYKAYQGRGIGRTMVDAFFDKLKEESEKGRNIEDIVASVVTDQGEKIARDYGFSLVKDYSETAHYKLFRKGENEI